MDADLKGNHVEWSCCGMMHPEMFVDVPVAKVKKDNYKILCQHTIKNI